ncbi:MAG: FAD-dependent oxidoreductase [Burkholderiales bacterium]
MRGDVCVVGAGAAGLMAAVAAAQAGASVLVVSKDPPGQGGASPICGGGFIGAWRGLSAEEHAARTFETGRGLNRPELVAALVEDAPARLQQLLDWGLRTVAPLRAGSMVAAGSGPRRGSEVVRCLHERALALGVRFASGLVVRSIRAGGEGASLAAFDTASAGWQAIACGALVLAAGGGAAMFARHDTAEQITGDAFALALGAGARLQDMEFVQFYALALDMPELPRAIIPGPVLDLGRLVNDRGEDLLDKHGLERRLPAVRARDRLAQALYRELKEGREVLVDFRAADAAAWNADPQTAGSWTFFRDTCGVLERPLRIAPAAHYVVDGVSFRPDASTDVPGLFVAGETGGGLHGANRMGENSLSETVVFGHRAGCAAAAFAKVAGRADPDLEALIPRGPSGIARSAADILAGIRATLWECGGIERRPEDMARGSAAIAALREEADQMPAGEAPADLALRLQAQMAARSAAVVLGAALRREESRGAHLRADHPTSDDARWLGHVCARADGDGLAWSFEPRSPMRQPALAAAAGPQGWH